MQTKPAFVFRSRKTIVQCTIRCKALPSMRRRLHQVVQPVSAPRYGAAGVRPRRFSDGGLPDFGRPLLGIRGPRHGGRARAQDRPRRVAGDLRRFGGPGILVQPRASSRPTACTARTPSTPTSLWSSRPSSATAPAGGQMGATGLQFRRIPRHQLRAAPSRYRHLRGLACPGAFDIPRRFLDGFYNQDAYLHAPLDYLPQARDPWFLERIRRNYYVLVVGNQDPLFDQNVKLAHVFGRQGNPAHSGCVGGVRARLAVVAQDGRTSFSFSEVRTWRESAFCTAWKSRSPRRWWTASTPWASPGVTRGASQSGRRRMAEPSGYDVIVDRISHDIPFYRSLPEERRARRHQGHQQSVLVERRRQVLQLRAGRQTGRGRAAHRAAAAQGASARHHRALHAQPAVIRSIGTGSSTTSASRRSSSRTMAAAGRTSTKSNSPEEFFAAYDESGDLCMTLQARRAIPGVFPLLRDRPGEGPRHALRSRRSRTICAT